MSLHIGDSAPNFVAISTQGVIEFHEWVSDSWALFFSHPGDFTPICTTEVGRISQLEHELSARHVKALGLSTDTVDNHYAWIDDINESQNTDMFVPLVSDPVHRIADLYDMVHTRQSYSQTIRSVYIIDPNKKIRLTMTYPMEVGRSFDEILRVLDALILADKHSIVTPVDWHPGDPVIIPTSTPDWKARQQFHQGWVEVLPYMRLTTVS